MLFYKAQNVVGLDIGTNSVKLVELDRSKNTFRLKNIGIAKLPRDTIVNGTIIHAELLEQTITTLFTEYKIKNKNVAISISGHPVIIKKITTDLMPEDELENTLPFEAEQYIPFSLDEVNLDFQILGPCEDKENKMNVMLVAAKRAMISDYVSVLQNAGLKAVIVDIDVFALENMFNTNYSPEQNITVALVDMGASVTNINIIKNGVSQFTRDIFMGGNQITEEIQRQLSINYEDAEALKCGEQIAGINQDLLKEIIERASSTITSEIQRSLDFYISSTYGEISQVYLSGGGSKTSGFREIFTKRVTVPMEYTNPFHAITYDENMFDAEYIKDLSPFAAVGVGLALRSMGD
jgi:type IV pilus assembly protein PilM